MHICLYIPIWLYSNLSESLNELFDDDLYIPIWLYSNGDLVGTQFRRFGLYIPIWLYSNRGTRYNNERVLTFTFQSGYIQIKCLARKKRSSILYIPIWLYSNWRDYKFYRRNSALHSNLFIFKFSFLSGRPLRQSSLHSNLVIFKSISNCKTNIFL